MKRAPVRVLFIGGDERSGSTMLDRVLGQIDGFWSTGELRFVWNWGVARNQLCECRLPFRSCTFWREVMDVAYGGMDRVDGWSLRALQRRVVRHRFAPQLIYPALQSRRFSRLFESYGRALELLYEAIATVSGARVIVDSSKNPLYGFALLHGVRSIDLRVVHLIRDSRAVAYSRRRNKLRPDIYWKQAYLPKRTPVQAAMIWNLANSLMEILAARSSKACKLRYEDMVVNPSAAVSRVASLATGEPEIDLSFIQNDLVQVHRLHTVAGNPSRFHSGPMRLRMDNEWASRMSPSDRRLVTALTFPLLLKYGFVKAS